MFCLLASLVSCLNFALFVASSRDFEGLRLVKLNDDRKAPAALLAPVLHSSLRMPKAPTGNAREPLEMAKVNIRDMGQESVLTDGIFSVSEGKGSIL